MRLSLLWELEGLVIRPKLYNPYFGSALHLTSVFCCRVDWLEESEQKGNGNVKQSFGNVNVFDFFSQQRACPKRSALPSSMTC